MIELDKISFPVPLNKVIKLNTTYFDKTISSDGVVKYKLNNKYQNTVPGIIGISTNSDEVTITLSGKILADKDNLGSITKENYKLIFEQLNKTKFIKVPCLTINQIKVFACDVKKDIIVSDIDKSLLGISKHLTMLSDKYNVMRYKDLSLFIKSYSKNCKDTLCIYRKYDELIKHD